MLKNTKMTIPYDRCEYVHANITATDNYTTALHASDLVYTRSMSQHIL